MSNKLNYLCTKRQENKFEFTIQPARVVCRHDIFTLAIVHTAPMHLKRRMAIRETWASQKYYNIVEILGMFFK
jgi:hypothetical protein